MPKTPLPPVSVFQFLDAREFLQKAYDSEKRTRPDFSHRYIARAMGAGSSSFFKDVLKGRARLSPARARKFARLFRLSAKEAEYFDTLVAYTQAETAEEKDLLLKNLTGGASRPYALLEAFQLEYFKKWHYAAVRELLAFHDFNGDYEKLGKMLTPAITAAEARNALQLLLKLKLIRKNAQGGYEKVDKVVSTGPGGAAKSAKPAIRGNLALAQRALDEYAPEVRPFSHLTLSVSAESFAQIRDRLRVFRKDILDLVTRDEAVDRLYQLNFQFFPLSKPFLKASSKTASKTESRTPSKAVKRSLS